MTPGDVVLVHMPTRRGTGKKRPALVLQKMEPFGDVLVCGISSQIQHEVLGFDLVLTAKDEGFEGTGLKRDSLFRLGYITTVAKEFIPGKIGKLPEEKFSLLIDRLTSYLRASTDDSTLEQ